ncbi:MAG: preQ(1) synthase [Planctomycetota bacterium]
MPDAALLVCFDNPQPQREYLIEHVSEEFTSVCPETGHPDFGAVTLQYVPRHRCIELKSLKLYLQSFRNEGIYYEAVTNKIADDLTQAMDPVWMQITTDWNGRGGIRSTVRVEVGGPGQGGAAAGLIDDDDEEFDSPRAGGRRYD